MIHPNLIGTRTLIFDMDGTLIASGRTAVSSLRGGLKRFYKKLGRPAPEYTDEQLVAGIGAPSEEFYRSLLRPEDRNLIEDFRSEILHGESSYMKKNRITFPGVTTTLRELKRRGYRMAVVSNCHTPYLHTVMETQNLAQFFERMTCIGDAEGATKSSLIHDIVEELGGPAVVIGDRYYDVDAATENGLPAIGALYGYGNREELKDTVTWVEDFRHLLDLLSPLRELAERIAANVTRNRPLDRPFVLSLSAPHPALTRELNGWLLTAFTDRNVPVSHLNLERHRQQIKDRSPEKQISDSFDWKKLDREILKARESGKIDSSWEITSKPGKGTTQPCRSRAGSVVVVEGSYLPNGHLKGRFDLSVWVDGGDRDVERAIPEMEKAAARHRAISEGGTKRGADESAKKSSVKTLREWKSLGSKTAGIFIEKQRPMETAEVVVDGEKLKRGQLIRWTL